VTITFDTADSGTVLRVTDAAEREQYELRVDRAIDPAPADPGEFEMPVEAAVAFEASKLRLESSRPLTFFEDGEAVARTQPPASGDWLDAGTYEVDLTLPEAKTYVKVCDAAVRGRSAPNRTTLELDSASRVVVGVRSFHERPAATVTTTEDPRDVMAVVSSFGSALKTQSPDRSWPTLRGHPPAVRYGRTLDVPEEAAPPDTGVTIEVPPEYGAIFSVASLAYYLGATVEPGTEPAVRAAGETWPLDEAALGADAAALLEHVFALDGAVRTVGVFPVDHEEAETLAERAALDYERLFELPLAERTAAYFDVPRTATADLMDWHLTADVQPEPRYAGALPHLVNELAAVRSPPPEPEPAERAPEPDALARSVVHAGDAPEPVLVPEPAGTPGQVWVGEGFAVNAATPTVGSFRRGLDWPQGEDPLDVHVVYNDARLEAADRAAYDVHEAADTDVRVSRSLTTSELRDALAADTDFLHFVGHVTERGMVCPDGELDVRTLPETGVGAFFLNGCRSYEQGFALLTAGAVGGIVTVDDVEDELAGAVGRDAAMLLDAGFPLYGVLDVLGRTGRDTGRYTVLGDSTLALRRHPGGMATLWAYDTDGVDADTDPVPITSLPYPVGENSLGTLEYTTYGPELRHLGSADPFDVALPREDLRTLLDNETGVSLVDGRLRRTETLSMEVFR
jgi:hypothetical protein